MYATASEAECVSVVDCGVVGVGDGEDPREGSGDEGNAVVGEGASLPGDGGHFLRGSCVSALSQHHCM
jgi:hypothetical protein